MSDETLATHTLAFKALATVCLIVFLFERAVPWGLCWRQHVHRATTRFSATLVTVLESPTVTVLAAISGRVRAVV